MKVGIIGAGSVGQSLGRALIRAGHEVMLSSRTPHSEDMQALATELNARVGTVEETLAFSNMIAFALRWDAVADVVKTAADWPSKIVIDMMNRFGPAPTGSAGSAAQDLALLTQATIVKALNTIGAEHYQNPQFGDMNASMFIASDDAGAKAQVTALLSDLGFDVIDAGDLAAASHLERLAEFWVYLATRGGQGRNVAFKLLRK